MAFKSQLKALQNKIPNNFIKEHLLEGVFSLGVIVLASGLVFFLAQPEPTPKKVTIEEVKEEIHFSAFDTVEIEARSAIVYDLETGEVLYQKDADRILPLASLTKVMTALAAIELIPEYTVVNIDKSFLEEEGDSGLFSDEQWRLKDLLDFSLVTSSNDGARAIASVAGAISNGSGLYNIGRDDFVEVMNKRAGELGLSRTKFWNETGLDVDEIQSGGYGSARDMVTLFSYVLKNYPELIEATGDETTTLDSLSQNSHEAENTNQVINQIPGIIGSKTGFTDLAGGNLIVAFNAGLKHPVIVAVLGSSFDGRFEDIVTLARAAQETIVMEQLQ